MKYHSLVSFIEKSLSNTHTSTCTLFHFSQERQLAIFFNFKIWLCRNPKSFLWPVSKKKTCYSEAEMKMTAIITFSGVFWRWRKINFPLENIKELRRWLRVNLKFAHNIPPSSYKTSSNFQLEEAGAVDKFKRISRYHFEQISSSRLGFCKINICTILMQCFHILHGQICF